MKFSIGKCERFTWLEKKKSKFIYKLIILKITPKEQDLEIVISISEENQLSA